MNQGQILTELQFYHLPITSFIHSIQPFTSDLLRSQLEFPANYQKHRFTSTCKRDPGAKLYRMLLTYLET